MAFVMTILAMSFGLCMLMFITSMVGGIFSNSIKWSDIWAHVCAISILALVLLMFLICAVGVIWLGMEVVEWLR